MKNATCIATLTSVLLATPVSAEPWFAKDDGPLSAAHSAYLERDDVAMTAAIRQLFEAKSGESERDNAVALLQKALEVGGGQVDTGWRPPKGVSKLVLTHGRKAQPDRVYFQLQLRGRIAHPELLRQVRVRHADGRVLLDRAAGVGQYATEKEDDGTFGFELEGGELDKPVDEGLVYIDFELADGTRASGWVLLFGHVASTAPQLLVPTAEQVFEGGQPQLTWKNYRSPEHRSYEARSVFVYVAELHRPGWSLAWSLYGWNPDFTDVVVGQEKNGAGASQLEPGEYWLSLIFHEAWRLGPVKVRRGSVAARGFSVR